MARCENHSWWIAGDNIFCDCVYSGWGEEFLTAKRLSEFHDQDLAVLSKKLNRMLEPLRAKGKKLGKDLGLLTAPNGIFLAWTTHIRTPSKELKELRKKAIASSVGATQADRNRALVALGIANPKRSARSTQASKRLSQASSKRR